MTGGEGVTRIWKPDWPCPIVLNLAPYRHGRGDPTFKQSADGSVALAWHTPIGSAAMSIAARPGEGVIEARAWGEGAAWMLEHLPPLLGADDDVSGFDPVHPALRRVWRRYEHWRIGASGLVFDSLLPVIIEQKVTGLEASSAYRGLVNRFGSPAPGPSLLGVRLAPSAAEVRHIPSWEWLKLSVDQARSRPIVHAAGLRDSLERSLAGGPASLDKALQSVPGIGRWTSAEVRSRVLGDADAVSFGDYHVAREVGWALTGAPADDAELEVLLEPFRPHRGRIQGLVQLGKLGPPRRGPRMSPRHHLPGGYR